MAAPDTTLATGLEVVGRQAVLTLHASLNTELAYQTSLWVPRDRTYAGSMGLRYEEVILEKIDSDNFYHGHRPSLIDANVDRYPNVSAMAYQARPNQTQGGDHFHTYDLRLYVEIMCKSANSEEEVNARIQRTTEAVHAVLLRDRTLGGTVLAIGDAPMVEITDVFAGREEKGRGKRFIWQGSRTDFNIQKTVNLHGITPNPGSWQDPFGLPLFAGMDLGVDQI